MSRLKKAYKQPRFRYSALAHCVAWANISIQVLFPLAVTFTPTMTARAHNAALPRLSTENTAVATDNNADKNIASFAANAGKNSIRIAFASVGYWQAAAMIWLNVITISFLSIAKLR